MEQRTLVRWLKTLVILAGACGLALCAGVFPMEGKWLAECYPEFAYCYLPWLFFLWVLAAPCFMALILAWRVFTNIEKDCSFSLENAEYLRKVSYLAALDAVLLIAGNVLYLILGMNHPGILLAAVLIAFAGIAVSVAAAVLSHLVRKASDLQEQSDLTI